MELKRTTITFAENLRPRDLPHLRGAVMELSGNQSFYHNHNEDSSFIYRYPLIQYKITDKPTIIGISEGADSLERLFSVGHQYTFSLGNEEKYFTVQEKHTDYIQLDLIEAEPQKYILRNWLPLNQINYNKYQQIEKLTDKILFLNNILTSNILSLYKGLGCQVDFKISATITSILKTQSSVFKNVRMVSMNIEFTSNVFLPKLLGLGKGASLGFGVIINK